LSTGEKIFFASDLHLGAPDPESSLVREKHFVKWLDYIAPQAAELYLLGDVFDFWFEYNRAIPKGYVRIFGKLAELHDRGVKIHYFTGNHDLWLRDYFTKEFGAILYSEPVTVNFGGKNYHLAHGDGLGPGDKGYKVLKRVFRNPLAKWSFHRLHPNFGIRLAHYFSRRSRKTSGERNKVDHGEKEYLIIYSREYLKQKPEIDYFVFGHRHFPRVLELENGKTFINLGDWISHFTFLEVANGKPVLKVFPMGCTEPVPF
jgi:UDP-2,3-diacylglucosamine hydrolase